MRKDTKSERNKKLIAFYLAPHNLRETGLEFGLSFQRVSEILSIYGIKTHKVKYELIVQDEPETPLNF